MYFNADFWSRFFRESFVRQIEVFCDVFESRVLPVFANVESEADEAAEREYDRIGSLPGGDDGPVLDMADAAELAQEAGLAHYEMLMATRQTFLNLAVTALYHLFEQQLLVFHRRQVLHPAEEHDPKLSTRVDVFKVRIEAAGIGLASFPTWSTIEELRLAANTIKHAEGASAKLLREFRPRLFSPPTVHDTLLESTVGTVDQPLAGEDIYVTVEDYRRYRDGLLSFWTDFGEAILNSERGGANIGLTKA